MSNFINISWADKVWFSRDSSNFCQLSVVSCLHKHWNSSHSTPGKGLTLSRIARSPNVFQLGCVSQNKLTTVHNYSRCPSIVVYCSKLIKVIGLHEPVGDAPVEKVKFQARNGKLIPTVQLGYCVNVVHCNRRNDTAKRWQFATYLTAWGLKFTSPSLDLWKPTSWGGKLDWVTHL